MHEQATEQKNNYFRELTLNLRHEGFTAGQPEDGLLPVEADGTRHTPGGAGTDDDGGAELRGPQLRHSNSLPLPPSWVPEPDLSLPR